MSEYIEIESELTAAPDVVIIHTNLALAVGNPERYDSPAAMEEGSAVAQALAAVDGIVALQIEAHDLVVKYDLDTPWFVIEAEIAAALKDFFL
jgi:hypothetical protein